MLCSRLLLITYLLCPCLLFRHQRTVVVGWSSSPTPTSRREALTRGIILSTATATSTVLVGGVHNVARASSDVRDANAVDERNGNNSDDDDDDDDRQKELQREIRQRLLERRKLMQASRSSNDRQSYLDLSRQRAALYNTTSRAVSCLPNIPCY